MSSHRHTNLGTSGVDRVIVSLTSFPARIPYIAPTLASIVCQVEPEDRVILWLGEEQFPNRLDDIPDDVTAYSTEHGGRIEFCYTKDVKSFKKLLPSLAKFPNDSIITLDDDALYSKKVIPLLKLEAKLHPGEIIAHCSSDLYKSHGAWRRTTGNVGFKIGIPFLRMMTGGGGVLYPPHTLDSIVSNVDLALRLCPTSDDIWFWFCAVRQGTRVRSVPHGVVNVEYIPAVTTRGSLSAINEVDGDRVNLQNLRHLLEFDPKTAEKLEAIYRQNRTKIFFLRVYRLLVRCPAQVWYCLVHGGIGFAWSESKRTLGNLFGGLGFSRCNLT